MDEEIKLRCTSCGTEITITGKISISSEIIYYKIGKISCCNKQRLMIIKNTTNFIILR
jgi:hypothetical protein